MGTRFRSILQVGLVCVLAVQAWAAVDLAIENRLSPWNTKRPVRQQTRYILLHTTEGATPGSLRKLQKYGEAHYLVAKDGSVYRIMDRKRIALHAGRSMWEGRTNLDNHSIGIEVTGYHNQPIQAAQIRSLRLLLRDLQRIYRIPDERVIPHSMVAYGTPNRWHRKSHRGRKRCGMQFADRALRAKLGLKKQPLFDPDVRAGRLVEADPYLAQVLYGSAREQSVARAQYAGRESDVIRAGRSAWDIARDQYRSEHTVYVYPDGTERTGAEIRDWKRMPAGTRVVLGDGGTENVDEGLLEIGVHGDHATEIAGDEILSASTMYFLVDGRVRQGSELRPEDVEALPPGTQMLVGYTHGGYVTAKRSAFDIAGAKWNHGSTYYRTRDGRILSGAQMEEGSIAPRTMVFFQR